MKRINGFEKRWKIKVNKNKFQLLSVSATMEVIVNQERIPLCNEVTIHGAEVSTHGVSTCMERDWHGQKSNLPN